MGRPCLSAELATATPHRYKAHYTIHNTVRAFALVLEAGGNQQCQCAFVLISAILCRWRLKHPHAMVAAHATKKKTYLHSQRVPLVTMAVVPWRAYICANAPLDPLIAVIEGRPPTAMTHGGHSRHDYSRIPSWLLCASSLCGRRHHQCLYRTTGCGIRCTAHINVLIRGGCDKKKCVKALHQVRKYIHELLGQKHDYKYVIVSLKQQFLYGVFLQNALFACGNEIR
jgi:hypothetical protein